MESLEIEVKYHISDAEADTLRKKLMKMCLRQYKSLWEENIRYEDASKSLIRKKSLLRLRDDGIKAYLTFKSPPSVEDTRAKVLNELEVEVSNFDMMDNILRAIGFFPEQLYEKQRESYIFEDRDTLACFDILPFGTFLEIEGNVESIRKASSMLGFAWEKRILSNYLELFEAVKKTFQLPFSDVTFANFETVDLDLSDFFRQFESGNK